MVPTMVFYKFTAKITSAVLGQLRVPQLWWAHSLWVDWIEIDKETNCERMTGKTLRRSITKHNVKFTNF